MKKLLLIVAVFTTPSAACPIGATPGTYGFGNQVCMDGASLEIINGSLQHCPAGFSISQDDWGNTICFDGKIKAYDLSNGCPDGLTKGWNRFGRTVCSDSDGKPVVELRVLKN